MTQNNKKIAITGGIGSGKSTVSDIIRGRFPVFSCDKIYDELLSSGLTEKIANSFGGVLTESGKLDKKKLSEIVFNNPTALEKLNKLTHTEIMNAAFKRMEEHKISFLEVPLLFENGLEKYFDGVIVVLRDIEERITSVAKRDGLDRLSVQKRIENQFNYDNSAFAKYYVIHNNCDLECLQRNVEEVLGKIVEKF